MRCLRSSVVFIDSHGVDRNVEHNVAVAYVEEGFGSCLALDGDCGCSDNEDRDDYICSSQQAEHGASDVVGRKYLA